MARSLKVHVHGVDQSKAGGGEIEIEAVYLLVLVLFFVVGGG